MSVEWRRSCIPYCSSQQKARAIESALCVLSSAEKNCDSSSLTNSTWGDIELPQAASFDPFRSLFLPLLMLSLLSYHQLSIAFFHCCPGPLSGHTHTGVPGTYVVGSEYADSECPQCTKKAGRGHSRAGRWFATDCELLYHSHTTCIVVIQEPHFVFHLHRFSN